MTLRSETGPPTAPELVDAVVTSESLTLIWTDNSNGETGYVIQRAPKPKGRATPAFEMIATVDADETEFVDSSETVLTGGKFIYRIATVFDETPEPDNIDAIFSDFSNEMLVDFSGSSDGGGGNGGGKGRNK